MITEKDINVESGIICISSKGLYELLEVEESTVVRWGQKKPELKVGRGLWNLKDVLKWRGLIAEIDENEPEKETPQSRKVHFDLLEAEARAEKLQIDNAIKKKEYLKVDVFVEELSKVFINMRSRLLSLPTRAASELRDIKKQSEKQAVLKKLVYEALDELKVPDFKNGNNSEAEYTGNRQSQEINIQSM